ncbi:hypothetical protein H0H87_002910 [Tephrocybe sp. NHM501043]|nr:hypothetical protein H0H87_002910 [Tephrocybe sp. NHM501043]
MSSSPGSPSSPSFVIHKLTYPDAPDCPTSLLIDERIIPHLPTPVHPPRLTPLGEDGTPCFEVRPAGDKGLGIFATRHIATGSLIVVDHPAIITPGKIPLMNDARSSAYRSLFDALPLPRRDELRTMTNSRSPEECNTMEEGISRTNGAAVDLGLPDEFGVEAKEYGAVFIIINRTNHRSAILTDFISVADVRCSCGPNAAHKWDLASFSSSLYALRPIAPGEEITMIYTDVTQNRDARRARLHAHHGFICHCPFCTLPSPLSEESDTARAALRDWRHTRPTFSGWATDLCKADDFVLKTHMEALALIEKEGLQGMESSFVRDVCSCWAMLGEEREYRIWAERLIKLSQVRDPVLAQEVMESLSDPASKVQKWGWRKKQKTPAKAELSRDYDVAFRLYVKAAELYLHLSRTIGDQSPLQAGKWKTSAGKALQRAEKIKAFVAKSKPLGALDATSDATTSEGQASLTPVGIDHFSARALISSHSLVIRDVNCVA